MKLYHNSIKKIDGVKDTPIFAVKDKKLAVQGWFANSVRDNKKSYLYEFMLTEKVYEISEIKKMFEKKGLNYANYSADLTSKSANEILQLEGTKFLLKNNVNAIVIEDYDPADWAKNTKSILIFHPKSVIKDFELIKEYPTSIKESNEFIAKINKYFIG